MPVSPNFGERRDGLRPEFVVIHYTAMESCAAAHARLCDPAAEVSAHYLLDYDGATHTLVEEAVRAWHAGAGQWCGLDDLNSRSIGIELANDGFEPFPEPQMAALEGLLSGIMARWSIPPQGVIGHSDMAPGRKSDPGARFDWARLARAGLSVWPQGTLEADPCGFVGFAQRFGYPDVPADDLLAAFRLRFRPAASGPVDPIDAGLAQDLAGRFAIDRAAKGA
ncbi:N-acetylmuramoyl-L-alanine amidase (plasmid) [Pseudorhodobacter turbinis]|uniref:N-acetylmuramoyl-L-alanine amidase n=1 Tax=Pseudorhodobacter turbinis TaxID=2500533 RepID=A0A4P8EJC0_9RHOB|nr:N-acetylmuramoyl-L-alanine amidase [Pseudorhodobacter turbinis]QCO57059.1 N-acetylmuramoyl-L-alanine amidase [Pseudorhodobacter turbinis]